MHKLLVIRIMNKKLFFLFCVFVYSFANAQLIFNISFADNFITSDNASYFACEKLQGKVNYNIEENILTLDNIDLQGDLTINFCDSIEEVVDIANLTINLIGNNNIYNASFKANMLRKLTLAGNGSLNIEEGSFIIEDSTDVFLQNCSLKVINEKDAINMGDNNLTISDADVYSSALFSNYALTRFENLYMEKCEIIKPKNPLLIHNLFNEDGTIAEEFEVKRFSVGMDKFITESEVLVYPNPTFDKVKIVSNEKELSFLSVYRADGRKIMEMPYNNEYISFKEFGKGVYFILLTGANGETTSKKIIVQ